MHQRKLELTRRHALLGSAVLLSGCTSTSRQVAIEMPSEQEARKILEERVKAGLTVGIAAALVSPKGTRFVSYGKANNSGAPVTANTVFEVASVTKVFTGLLLADAVLRGEVALDDPATKYLPPGMTALEWPGRPVTLADLATHTSGLPGVLSQTQPGAPPLTLEQSYSVAPEDLYAFLRAYKLKVEPGTQYLYSNLGAGLLGHILALRVNTTYLSLIHTRILAPLGMSETGGFGDNLKLADGHDFDLNPIPHWQMISGAGGLEFSAHDLALFLSAAAGLKHTPLDRSFKAMLATQRNTIIPDTKQALGWQVRGIGGRNIAEKSGNLTGFASYIGYDLDKSIGVAVLSNSPNSIEDVGRHLLYGTPLDPIRQAIPVDPARLDGLVGRYQLPPPPNAKTPSIITIVRQGDAIFMRLNDSPLVKLYRESGDTFFLRLAPITLAFKLGADGRASSLDFQQGGRPKIPANRVGG